ncbi:MAG: hypothetical protein WD605_00690 [Candidatus Paceibacterota bacterium]
MMTMQDSLTGANEQDNESSFSLVLRMTPLKEVFRSETEEKLLTGAINHNHFVLAANNIPDYVLSWNSWGAATFRLPPPSSL